MLVKEACERLCKKTCKPNRVLSNRVLSKRISNETNLVLSNRIVCNLYNKSQRSSLQKLMLSQR